MSTESVNTKIVALIVILFVAFGTFKIYERVRTEVDNTNIVSTFDMYAGTETVGNLQKYSLFAKTGSSGEDSEISVLSLRLVDPAGNKLLDADGNTLDELGLAEEFTDTSEWKISVNKIYEGDGKTYLDLSMAKLGNVGYKTQDYALLGTFYVQVPKQGVKLPVFEISKDYSSAYSKKRPVTNIWDVQSLLTVKS